MSVDYSRLFCQGAASAMRTVIATISISLIVCGCSQHGGLPRLEPLAHGLSEAMQPVYGDFQLEVRPTAKRKDRVILHCVLRNVSIAGAAIDVDESTLPWRNADMFTVDAVAANGTIVRRYTPPSELSRISGTPKSLSIQAGQSIEGEMDLAATSANGLPRNEDLLLLWSASIHGMHAGDNYVLRGVMFLNATS